MIKVYDWRAAMRFLAIFCLLGIIAAAMVRKKKKNFIVFITGKSDEEKNSNSKKMENWKISENKTFYFIFSLWFICGVNKKKKNINRMIFSNKKKIT